MVMMNVRLVEGGAKMEALPRYFSIKLSGKVNRKAVEAIEMVAASGYYFASKW